MSNKKSISHSRTKRQHFVPEFYLRQFADEKNQLHVYDRKSRKVFLSSPNKLCNERFLYETCWIDASDKFGEFVSENKIERDFSKKEGKYSKLIKNISERIINCADHDTTKICTAIEKNNLIEYTVNIYLRHPYTMFYAVNELNHIVSFSEADIYKTINHIFDLWGVGSPNSLFEHAIKAGYFNQEYKKAPAHLLNGALQSMQLCFLYSPNNNFLTSSFPVLISASNDKPYCVYFPQSHRLALCFLDKRIASQDENQFLTIDSRRAEQLNQLFFNLPICQAQYIISKDDKTLEECIP